MKLLFFFSLLIVFYTYAGYPIVITFLALFRKKAVRKGNVEPTVSILCSVYNEEKHLERKIRNLLDLDYPEDRIEWLIGSDGSTDKTNEILEKQDHRNIRFYKSKERKGKASILNQLSREAKGDVIVFTDARQRLDRRAVRELVRNFADEEVGCVSGELYLEGDDSECSEGVGAYWSYEKLIRKTESKMGSIIGATGALYAIRRELYPLLPENTILDDVYIPLCIVLKGYRAVYDSEAKVYDRFSTDVQSEFARKVRTLSGNYQILVYIRKLINPIKSMENWQFHSHKVLRLLVPYFLFTVYLSNLFLLGQDVYNLLFLLQNLFYGFALLGRIVKRNVRLFKVPYMLCIMNLAAVVALVRFLSHKDSVLWEKTS